MTTATAADEPAEWSSYRPGVLLFDADGGIIGRLPLAACAQVLAWHRNPSARPLRYRDEVGQLVSLDRAHVASVVRRDVDACVLLEQRDREKAWSEDDE